MPAPCHVNSPTIKQEQVTLCRSTCVNCFTNKELCDDCINIHQSIYPQLRACERCLMAGVRCRKLTVLGISMDCESNNALAMRKLDDKDQIPEHLLLRYSIPDAVHAAKKVYRASANWWLWLDGQLINNIMLRSLRQFDEEAAALLRPIISDSALRNRDWVDYGCILEAVDRRLHDAVSSVCMKHGSQVTVTLYPDPFWKDKSKGPISSINDLCAGKNINLVIVLRGFIVG